VRWFVIVAPALLFVVVLACTLPAAASPALDDCINDARVAAMLAADLTSCLATLTQDIENASSSANLSPFHTPSSAKFGAAVRVAARLKAIPTVSQDARRPFVQGNTIFKLARSDADYATAISLYEQAVTNAPWFSDAWFNLSLALEKSRDFSDAVTAMKYYSQLQSASTSDQSILDRIYALESGSEGRRATVHPATREFHWRWIAASH
jgi:hypothetical protein